MATVAKSMLDAAVKGYLENLKSKRHFVFFQSKTIQKFISRAYCMLTKLQQMPEHLFWG
jgi:hypothetical protein